MKEISTDLLYSEVKQKAARYCAYQERTKQQVRAKLLTFGMDGVMSEVLIDDLIRENFLNEMRFARAYSSGKFNIKKWGRIKISAHLKQLGLEDETIQTGLKEIDGATYKTVMLDFIESKSKDPKIKSMANSYEKNHKISLFLIRKGFEPELVWKAIKEWEI